MTAPEPIAAEGARRSPPPNTLAAGPLPLRPTERGARAAAERVAVATTTFALTRRQAAVLGLLIFGLANKEIAQELRCSEANVEMHVSALLRRTSSSSRLMLIARFWLELVIP